MPLGPGAAKPIRLFKSQAATPKLEDFGVTHSQSSCWQKKLGALDDEAFEIRLAGPGARRCSRSKAPRPRRSLSRISLNPHLAAGGGERLARCVIAPSGARRETIL